MPLQIRLEPSVLRVRDRPDAQLNLIIDNRNGRHNRDIDLSGRDPEGVIQFWFSRPSVLVLAGQVSTIRVGVSAAQSPPEQETQRQFSLIAIEGSRETEAAAGTLIQFTSEAKTSRLALILSAAAVLSAVAIAAAVLWIVLGRDTGNPETAAGAIGTTSEVPPTSEVMVTGSEAPPPTSEITTTTESPPSPPEPPTITFEGMELLVREYYAEVTVDPGAAWRKLAPIFDQPGGLSDYVEFWSSIRSVEVIGVWQRDDTSVFVNMTYFPKARQPYTEGTWLGFGLVDGKLLITEQGESHSA